MPISLKKYEIKVFAGLRTGVGAKSIRITTPEELVAGELLKIFTENFPNLKPLIWSEDGNFTGSILVLINGKDIRHQSGLDTLVSPEDKIEIFPPVSGG
jgi:molybdopterin synthase sulfur carrier subunit